MSLKRNVLVLNQDYSPMSICNVEKAFILIFLKKAELIAEAEDASLRTVDRSFPMPSVVRLNRYISLPYRGVVLSRHNIFKRDGFECQYCGTSRDLTIDHIIPRSKGGGDGWKNLVTACRHCNAKKGDRSPEEAGMKLKKIPAKPSYIMFLKELGNGNGAIKDWEPYLRVSA